MAVYKDGSTATLGDVVRTCECPAQEASVIEIDRQQGTIQVRQKDGFTYWAVLHGATLIKRVE